jgi:hypothetical protein
LGNELLLQVSLFWQLLLHSAHVECQPDGHVVPHWVNGLVLVSQTMVLGNDDEVHVRPPLQADVQRSAVPCSPAGHVEPHWVPVSESSWPVSTGASLSGAVSAGGDSVSTGDSLSAVQALMKKLSNAQDTIRMTIDLDMMIRSPCSSRCRISNGQCPREHNPLSGPLV